MADFGNFRTVEEEIALKICAFEPMRVKLGQRCVEERLVSDSTCQKIDG